MKKIISVILVFLLLCGCGFRNETEKFTDYSFDYFDTVTTIVGYEADKQIFNQNCKKIKKQLEEYHKLYDIYIKYENINNLSVINDSKEPVKVDKKIIDMLVFSKKMYLKTNSHVNIAMGSVLKIWHQYRTEGINDPINAKLPPFDILKTANEHTNIENLVIDEINNTVFLNDAEMSLDVGAIAKGYAVEQTALFMEENGIKGYLLNVGGNVRIVGKRQDGKKWKIGIENPNTDDNDKPYAEYLELDGMSLVTSGSYQRFYVVDGKNYHHIIDGKTLMPAKYFASVSVLSKSSAVADALSTALFSMDYENGRELIEQTANTEALWILPNGEKLYSSNFNDYTVKK